MGTSYIESQQLLNKPGVGHDHPPARRTDFGPDSGMSAFSRRNLGYFGEVGLLPQAGW